MAWLVSYGANSMAAIRTSLMDRTNFLLQSSGMVLNDVFFLLLWYMFFAGFKRIGSWQLSDVALLLGLIMMIVAISGIFFGGYRDMAAAILRGEVDGLLTQPKGILSRLLARESIATAWGDGVMGIWMLATFAEIAWRDLPLVVIAIASGTVVYVASAVIFASLAFWFGGARSFARDLTDFMLLFSSYPGSIYSGATKIVAYTLLPAGFIVLAPVQFLRTPTLATLFVLIGAASGYGLLANLSFQLGMLRYRRGMVATG